MANSQATTGRGDLAIHTITTKPLSLIEAVKEYSARGVQGISVWEQALKVVGVRQATQIIADHGMTVPALVRGGFFCAESSIERKQRVEANRRLIDIASELTAEMMVIVAGAVPKVPLPIQRKWVCDSIHQLADQARQAGVRLAIEPLHPMYAGDKSCINRIVEAQGICEQVSSPMVGVAVDVYHVWWDPELESQIHRLGQSDRLFGFHLCDWRIPTRDLLNDRELMGKGCIPIQDIRGWIEAAGFRGWHEVEIFSDHHWQRDQRDFLDEIVDSYGRFC